MITVSKRQKEIVEYLIKQTDYVTICDIAMKFSISDRTCRNDLSSIGTFLKESGLSLSRKTGKGVFLNCTPEEKRKISELLKTADTRFYNRRERENLVIALLLISETTTFQELAEVCLVSKQTVIYQFDSLEQRLRRNTLAIVKVPGRG
ncbi:MAG: DeoR family transcriptional regulator, partial [Clostridiales bacterium]|nr:DeoR family transcriptional regulator [Clostridiales bacterium]